MRKNILLGCITCFVLTLAGYGQCDLPVDKAPKLRGVSLGMSSEEVIALFGKPFAQDAESISYMDSWPDTSAKDLKFYKPANFDGVRRLSMTLAENRVSNVLITYRQVEWDSAQEFANALSEKLTLPKLWTYIGQKARMECKSWTITADARNNEIFLVDQAPIVKKIRDEQKQADQKKKDFKP